MRIHRRGAGPLSRSVLVVDDEPTVTEVVGRFLERAGYRPSFAADGHEAIARVAAEDPDLVILDVALPGVDGLTVLRRIRETKNTPVIVLSAKGEPHDRIVGLRMGADDFVAKPFEAAELVARVGAVLRRVDKRPAPALIECDGIEIDPVGRRASVRGQAVHLTRREFDLLAFFVSRPGQAFSQQELLEAVWPHGFHTAGSTLHVHVRRLRTKIEEDPARPVRLQTVWGFGYRFARAGSPVRRGAARAHRPRQRTAGVRRARPTGSGERSGS